MIRTRNAQPHLSPLHTTSTWLAVLTALLVGLLAVASPVAGSDSATSPPSDSVDAGPADAAPATGHAAPVDLVEPAPVEAVEPPTEADLVVEPESIQNGNVGASESSEGADSPAGGDPGTPEGENGSAPPSAAPALPDGESNGPSGDEPDSDAGSESVENETSHGDDVAAGHDHADSSFDPDAVTLESASSALTSSSVTEATVAATIAAAPTLQSIVGGPPIDQCNDTGSVGGDTITCEVTITNNCTYNPATPSIPTCETTIVTEISCTGSAVCPTGGTTIQSEPVTVITQCNNAGIGGASTVTCTVTVTNNLLGFPIGAVIDSTVLQCQSPGGVSTLTCVATPPGNNRAGSAGPGGQSVTQCNNSGGPGGTMTCTVTAPTSQDTGMPITIDQCNASGPEGASTVTCTATITNNFIDSIPPDDDDGSGGGGGGGGGGGPDGGGPGGGSGGGGSGGDGSGGDGSGSGGGGSDVGLGGGSGDGSSVFTSTSTSTSGSGSGSGGSTGDADRRNLPFSGLEAGALAAGGTLLILLGVALLLGTSLALKVSSRRAPRSSRESS